MMLYNGIIEDRNDPLELGRVRVRIIGLHNTDKNAMPTEHLPWAVTMQPVSSAGNSGVGSTPNLVVGSFVIVYFTDGDDMQQPMILGTIAGIQSEHLMSINGKKVSRDDTSFGFHTNPKDTYIGESDLPKLARSTTNEFPRTQHTSSNKWSSITEPADIRSNHTYPYNHVRQSESGHHEEWDDTPGNERINTQHMSGTFEEIRPDGTIVRKIVGDSFIIHQQDDNVYVNGTVNLHINTDCNTYIKGNWNVHVGGNMDLDVDGHITQDAATINLNSGTMGAARIGDTADTKDKGGGSHFDSNSAGSDKIETGSGTVFIGD